MKSILYVGATLMIGASIYGFVDYKNTSHKKEFTTMYEERKKPLVIADNKTSEPIVTKEANTTEKIVVTKKKAVSKNTAIKSGDEVITASETTETEKPVVKKKKKRISSKIFSRAPIREDEEELLEETQPAKTEVKKTEDKEQ